VNRPHLSPEMKQRLDSLAAALTAVECGDSVEILLRGGDSIDEDGAEFSVFVKGEFEADDRVYDFRRQYSEGKWWGGWHITSRWVWEAKEPEVSDA
jgi:hypothetical protein